MFEVRRFDKRYDRTGFDCGDERQNRYLAHYAGQDEKRGRARVHLLIDVDAGERIAAFCTLHATHLSLQDVSLDLHKDFANVENLPLAEIGQAASDIRYKGQGLLPMLLFRVMRAALHDAIAVMGFIVKAQDASLIGFYERLGFVRLVDEPSHLIISYRRIP